jgi:Icc-related predicted phosphoesterase
MRVHVLSDLHLEFGSLALPHTNADVVVLAGDIHTKKGGLKWIKETFQGQPVVYVLGNHEYYGTSVPYLTEKLREESTGSNVKILDNEATTINGVRFLGCTLWTDFALSGASGMARAEARYEMNDYRRIRLSTAQFRKLQPADTARFHARSLAWPRRELVDSSPLGKVVIISHHAPSRLSLDSEMETDLLSAAFASNLDAVVADSQADLWVHGHIHSSSDYMLGQTRVLCNPRGYPDSSNPNFDLGLVVEV